MRRIMVAALIVAAGFGVAWTPGRAGGFGPAMVAINRCDNRNINDIENQIRGWEKHPPRSNDVDGQVARMNDLQDAISALGQERGVLDAVCPDNVPRAPFNAQIAGATAWALVLEADVLTEAGPPCPSAGNAIPDQLAAGAWLNVAAAVSEAGGTVPNTVAEVVPKVQALAKSIDLTLPSYSDTSAYWRDQIAEKSKAALAACQSPAPSPAPSASP